jgi:hypothetical protein
MPRAIVHLKSQKQIFVEHPWTVGEWMEWFHKRSRSQATILVCDEKGNQYIISVYEVELIMVPLEEDENDGK